MEFGHKIFPSREGFGPPGFLRHHDTSVGNAVPGVPAGVSQKFDAASGTMLTQPDGTPRTAFPTLQFLSLRHGPRRPGWTSSHRNQKDQLKTTTSLRARKGVAISRYNVQISDAVPGDSHVASLLGMTAVVGTRSLFAGGAVIVFDCTAERHAGRSLRFSLQGTAFFTRFLPLTVALHSARINLCKFIA